MPSKRKAVTRGSDVTRSLLIRTAVDLYAVRGVDGVSLREIGVTAGQANNAVLHYYFGNQEGLLRAIVEEFAQDLDLFPSAVADLLAPGRKATAHDLAEALVLPLAQLLESEPTYLQFIARVMSDPVRATLLAEEPASQWFRAVAERVRADLGADVFAQRFGFAVTLTVHALADRTQTERRQAPEGRETFIAELADAVAAVLAGGTGTRPGARERRR